MRQVTGTKPGQVHIRAVKSIDEITCDLEDRDIADPEGLAQAIKDRIKTHIGAYITCSIGFAANRQLAKIAGKTNKPDGATIWKPEDMPAPLLNLSFGDIPGIGRNMEKRLYRAGVFSMPQCILPRALIEGTRGEPYAESHSRSGKSGGSRG